MVNRYDWGIYRGINYNYDYKDKEKNISDNVRYMLNRSLQMFVYENLPSTIPQRELELLLQTQGFVVVSQVNGNLYALQGTLSGEMDEYSRPSEILVTNIKLKLNKVLKIGVDCEIFMNDDVGIGLIPIYTKYSRMLSENEITMILSIISKRNNNIMSATDDPTSESAKTYIKLLEKGELGVIMENKLYDSFKVNPLSEGGSNVGDLIDLHQYIKATMYNEIGLKDNINMKKERLIEDELNSNNDIIFPLVDSMLNSRVDAVERINEMYGTNISVELGSSWKKRSESFITVESEGSSSGVNSSEIGEGIESQNEQISESESIDDPTE